MNCRYYVFIITSHYNDDLTIALVVLLYSLHKQKMGGLVCQKKTFSTVQSFPRAALLQILKTLIRHACIKAHLRMYTLCKTKTIASHQIW